MSEAIIEDLLRELGVSHPEAAFCYKACIREHQSFKNVATQLGITVDQVGRLLRLAHAKLIWEPLGYEIDPEYRPVLAKSWN